MDDKKKKMLIGGAAVLGVLVTGIGATVAIMSGGDDQPKGKPGYQTATPTLADAQAQPGALSIEPMPVALSRTPDGKVQGIATVSALFQDFTVGSVQLSGDARLSYASDCLTQGAVLTAGQRCNVTITFDGSKAATPGAPIGATAPAPAGSPPGTPATAGPTTPEIVVMGQSKSPGGSVIPVEARAQITGADPNAPMAGAGGLLPGSIPAGSPAPGGIDPYGPISPMPPTATGGVTTSGGIPGVTSGSGLPVAPSVDSSTGAPSAQQAGPPPLSPREQFMLARRQAVFSRIPARRPLQADKPQGTWADLNIPTSTSSYQQDMSRVVTMDRIITAVLVRPFDSRTSQQVVAQVDRNVYGGHGRTILIPRGSQVIGTASGGGERIAIQWKQIIRPDGARLMIEATAGDAMGQGGVPGRVNQRLLKRYGSILLGTVLKAGVAKAFGAEETPSVDPTQGGQVARNNGAIITDIVKADLEKVITDINSRNQQIMPIISVPAGTRLTIVPTMDLQMRPMVGAVQEARTYPRRQNGGAPAPSMPGNDDDDSYDAPQSRSSQRRSGDSPLPPADAPSTGATPPWDAN